MIYKKRVVIVNDNDLSNDINSAQEAADSAILEQQRIYYRSKEGRIPYGAADPTDIWITNHDDRYNELSNENAATAWSTKITPIARGIDSNENEDKYLYLYTCVQKRIVSKDAVNYTLSSDTTVNASKLYYERSGMTDNYVYTVISNPSGNPHENQYYEQSPKVPHTEILLDETTTVIDGGKIITGSVMANRLNAASINAWHQLSIGAFDADTTKAISNSTYITFIDTQTGIRVHSVEDENNYVQINATDIRLIRANTPRMILGATNFGFSDENGIQRLSLNATDGATIGYTNNIYTQVKNEGFYIYNGASSQTNKKLTQITSSGLEIFDSADGSSIAFYGQATRIGKENSYHTSITSSGVSIWSGTEQTQTEGTNRLASFGNSIIFYKPGTNIPVTTLDTNGLQIGSSGKQRMEITSNNLCFYDTFNKVMLQFAATKKNSSSTTNDAPWLCIGDASATRITLGITDAPYLYMNAGGTQCFNATSSGVQVGSSTNYALINTNGMEVFKGGTTAANSRAQFFDTIRLGSSTGMRTTISSTALEMYDENNQRRIRVNSGEGVIVGRPDKGRAVITDQGMTIYDVNNTDVAFYGSTARIGKENGTHLTLEGTYYNSYLTLWNTNGAKKSLRLRSDGDLGSITFLTDYVTGSFQNKIEAYTYDDGSWVDMYIQAVGKTTPYLSIGVMDSNVTAAAGISFGIGNTFPATGGINSSHAINVTSDRRIKTHISYLQNDAIRFIKKLKPAYFRIYEQESVGFYAQDIEEVDEWHVFIGESKDGLKTLNYTGLIAPLVAYCQHLENRIEALERR